MPVGTTQQGVMIPQSQLGSPEDGPPMTVRHVGEMKVIQTRYYDEGGRGHDEVWFVGLGGVVYQPPNSEVWASELRPVKDELALQVLARLGLADDRAKRGPVPEDVVDVLEGEKGSSRADTSSP